MNIHLFLQPHRICSTIKSECKVQILVFFPHFSKTKLSRYRLIYEFLFIFPRFVSIHCMFEEMKMTKNTYRRREINFIISQQWLSYVLCDACCYFLLSSVSCGFIICFTKIALIIQWILLPAKHWNYFHVNEPTGLYLLRTQSNERTAKKKDGQLFMYQTEQLKYSVNNKKSIKTQIFQTNADAPGNQQVGIGQYPQ